MVSRQWRLVMCHRQWILIRQWRQLILLIMVKGWRWLICWGVMAQCIVILRKHVGSQHCSWYHAHSRPRRSTRSHRRRCKVRVRRRHGCGGHGGCERLSCRRIWNSKVCWLSGRKDWLIVMRCSEVRVCLRRVGQVLQLAYTYIHTQQQWFSVSKINLVSVTVLCFTDSFPFLSYFSFENLFRFSFSCQFSNHVYFSFS